MIRLATIFLLPFLLFGHDIIDTISVHKATVIRTTYSDGTPLKDAAFVLYAPDEKSPWQEGKTAQDGTIAFVPPQAGTYRVRIATKDGHGLVSSFYTHPQADMSQSKPSVLSWYARIGLTLLVLFALLGVRYTFVLLKKR